MVRLTWRGSRKHFHDPGGETHEQKQTLVYLHILKRCRWCDAARFRRGTAGSSRHNPGRPSRRTAAPPSRRWSPCVCGSRLRRAWRSACIAPELCPHLSAPEHLLDTNRQTWEHNETQCSTINIVLIFSLLIRVNLWVTWQRYAIIPRSCWRSGRKHPPPAPPPHSTNSPMP